MLSVLAKTVKSQFCRLRLTCPCFNTSTICFTEKRFFFIQGLPTSQGYVLVEK
jgi:hypothetical protein